MIMLLLSLCTRSQVRAHHFGRILRIQRRRAQGMIVPVPWTVYQHDPTRNIVETYRIGRPTNRTVRRNRRINDGVNQRRLAR